MPFGINDSGQIVGDYIDSNGGSHAFLTTPAAAVPEPETACLIVIGLGAFAVLTGRRSRRVPGVTTSSLHWNA
jgi:probable HAF family extracellular repeat protein